MLRGGTLVIEESDDHDEDDDATAMKRSQIGDGMGANNLAKSEPLTEDPTNMVGHLPP